MASYDEIRQQYRPHKIKVLMIAESPPPAANVQSSRHFYRSEVVRRDDRLFTNTIRALYPETTNLSEKDLETDKAKWLKRFRADGWYMIEALSQSQPHEVTKMQRQERILAELSQLLQKVANLASPQTKIILIKSNVFDVTAEPLRQAGYHVLNSELVDYPGRFNQSAYRAKLATLAKLD